MKTRNWIAIFGAALGAFMAILDIQITNASLREIQGALGLDVAEGGWISTSYLIAEIIIIPLTAIFTETWGLKRCTVAATIVFLISSVLCGAAWSLESVIAFRALQGFSGGALIPLAFQIILNYTTVEKRPYGLAIFGLTITLAPTLGPSLGGFLTDNYGWRTIFYVNLFPGVLLIACALAGLRDSKSDVTQLRKLSKHSVLLMTVGLAAVTYLLEEGAHKEWFDSNQVRIAFLLAIICLPIFVVEQFFNKNPVLKLSLFKQQNFCIGTLITALTGCTLFSGIYALSIYLSQIQDYSAMQIGSVMIWIGIPQIIIMPFVPFLMNRMDPRWLAFLGLVIFAYSNYNNTALSVNFGGDEFRWSLIWRAVGQPLFIIPLSAIAMSLVQKEDVASASAIFNVMRNLGASIGIALTSTFLISRENQHYQFLAEQVTDESRGNARYKALVLSLRTMGDGLEQAKVDSLNIVSAHLHKEALIRSFSDLYLILGCVICVAAVLILMVRRPRENTELSIH